MRQQAHWDLTGKVLSNGARPGLSEPEAAIILLNYLRSTVSATKYMRETNKSSSAEPLGERAMLVTTGRLELGRKGCEVTEPNQDS